MKKYLFISMIVLALVLSACGNDELLSLDVDFIVPETVEVGETVELKAVVTYGEEAETEATVKFEVWETGDKDNSEMLEAENHGDGTYTVDYTFDQDGVFEMYAHTDAQNLHTMPKKSITVGEGGNYDQKDHSSHSFHTEGFDMHFMEPEAITRGEDTELMVHIMVNEDALEDANVRFEIWQEGDEDNTSWVETAETNPGEYVANHSFEESGAYKIQIHVENDEDLHEHLEYEIEVE